MSNKSEAKEKKEFSDYPEELVSEAWAHAWGDGYRGSPHAIIMTGARSGITGEVMNITVPGNVEMAKFMFNYLASQPAAIIQLYFEKQELEKKREESKKLTDALDEKIKQIKDIIFQQQHHSAK